MSFQTVLSLVGVAFTAFELYQRFRPKSSSGSAQSPFSPQTEPKHSDSGAGESQATSKTLETSKSEGLSREPTSEAPSVQKSEWPKLIYFFLPLKCQNKIN